jgi:hypothetical protein
MKKAAIPTVRTGDSNIDRAFDAVKQNLDVITGQIRGVDKFKPLPPNATLEQVITRLNEVVARLQ